MVTRRERVPTIYLRSSLLRSFRDRFRPPPLPFNLEGSTYGLSSEGVGEQKLQLKSVRLLGRQSSSIPQRTVLLVYFESLKGQKIDCSNLWYNFPHSIGSYHFRSESSLYVILLPFRPLSGDNDTQQEERLRFYVSLVVKRLSTVSVCTFCYEQKTKCSRNNRRVKEVTEKKQKRKDGFHWVSELLPCRSCGI